MPTCEHLWCVRGTLTGRSVCHAHYTNVRCELKDCNEWAWHPYTTCKKHSRLLQSINQEPFKLMALDDMWRSRVIMSDEQFDFRFSASYASRYNNCHGSANLEEAIPGFQHPERNDNGMKGVGTKLHKIFEVALSDPKDLEAKAQLLEMVAGVWGPKRTALLQDEKKFIVMWFMQKKTAPPIEFSVLADSLLVYTPTRDTDGNLTGETVITSIEPRRINFLAEALRYVATLIEEKYGDDYHLRTEYKVEADWLTTKPKTTVDLVIYNGACMDVLDLKMGEIEVSPFQNQQLMYYAYTLAAFRYDEVTLHIIQRNYTDSWTVPRGVLEKWADKMRKSEQEILAGDLTLTPGEHCKFCPANPHGRGDKGSKGCPAMLKLLFGERDKQIDEASVLEGDME